MPLETTGIHHVTAIASDPQANLDFYAGVLGMRLVKRTVNFDDPGTYHFYFGDATGRPGSLLTFFPWIGARRGRPGPGMVTRVSFAAPAASLAHWRRRLEARGVAIERTEPSAIAFRDPDGLPLEIVSDDAADAGGVRADGPLRPEHALRGIHGVTLEVAQAGPTLALLTEGLGFRPRPGNGATNGAGRRLVAPAGGMGARVEVRERGGVPAGEPGAGTVHHIAWRARDDEEQRRWSARLVELGRAVTPVRDRCYFRSIYFHEPGGVLYEIATDPPGFTLDEPADALGVELKLPAWLEASRRRIERVLPPLVLPREAQPR